ncbi:MAG: SlyX family protein [Kofleriaceae bacterium]
MAESLTDSVTDLEIRVAYQDRTLVELDEVVRTLHRRVEQLEAALVELRQSVADAPAVGPGNEPPPHY